MNTKTSTPPRNLIMAFIFLCGMLLACEGLIDSGGLPPTLSTGEVTAQADLRQSRIATAEAVATSGLVRETKIITSVASVLKDPGYDYELHYDGKWLWISHRKEVLAIDPESGEIVVRPLTFDTFAGAVVSDGQQIWWQTDSGLQAVDIGTGKAGAFIPVKTGSDFLAYDGERLWFFGQDGLLSADPVSRQVLPPIAPDKYFNDGVMDDTRTFLWLANTTNHNIVQKYDLKQNQLLDTPLRFHGPNSLQIDDGRLWVQNDTYDWASYDTFTGEKVAFLHNPSGGSGSVLGGGRFWSGDTDLWTIRSYDTMTGQLYPPIPVSGIPARLAFDGKRLWFVLFDPETEQIKGLQYITPN